MESLCSYILGVNDKTDKVKKTVNETHTFLQRVDIFLYHHNKRWILHCERMTDRLLRGMTNYYIGLKQHHIGLWRTIICPLLPPITYFVAVCSKFEGSTVSYHVSCSPSVNMMDKKPHCTLISVWLPRSALQFTLSGLSTWPSSVLGYA